jgi:hypothetical protein
MLEAASRTPSKKRRSDVENRRGFLSVRGKPRRKIRRNVMKLHVSL